MPEAETQARRVIALLDRLRWGHALLISVTAAAIVGVFVYMFVPLRYAASASILASQTAPTTLEDLLRSTSPSDTITLGSMEQMLKSRRIRSAVLKKHELESQLGLSPEDALKWLGDATNIEQMLSRDMMRGGLGLRIQVTVPGTSRIASMMGHPKPLANEDARELSAQLANEYVAALQEYLIITNAKSAQEVLQFVTQRISEAQAALSETERSIEELQRQHLLVDPDIRTRVLIEHAQDANAQYEATRRDIADLEFSLNASRHHLQKEDAQRIAAQVTQRNPTIMSIEQRIAGLRMELATHLAEGKMKQHPDVVATEAAIEDGEQQLDQVSAEVLQQVTQQPNPLYESLLEDVIRFEVQLAGRRARQAALSDQLQAAETQLADLPPLLREYADLNRRKAIQTETLTALTREKEMAAINVRRDSTKSFSLLDEAIPPTQKAGPSAVRAAAMAMVLLYGLLALGLAYRRGMFADHPGESRTPAAKADGTEDGISHISGSGQVSP